MLIAGGMGMLPEGRKVRQANGAGATFVTGGNQVGNGRNVGDNHDDNIEEVKHSNNEHPEFPASVSRLEQPANRR